MRHHNWQKRTTYGATQFTLIFFGAKCWAILLVNPTTPCLLTVYASPTPATAVNPTILETFTIDAPSEDAFLACARTQCITPVRLVPIIWSQSAASRGSLDNCFSATPATLAAPYKGPSLSVLFLIHESTCAESRTSNAVVRICDLGLFSDSISALAFPSPSALMSASYRAAPRWASNRAAARPIPEAAPVTATSLPAKDMIIDQNICWRGEGIISYGCQKPNGIISVRSEQFMRGSDSPNPLNAISHAFCCEQAWSASVRDLIGKFEMCCEGMFALQHDRPGLIPLRTDATQTRGKMRIFLGVHTIPRDLSFWAAARVWHCTIFIFGVSVRNNKAFIPSGILSGADM